MTTPPERPDGRAPIAAPCRRPTRRPPAVLAVLVVLAAVATMAGCGVKTDDRPQEISRSNVSDSLAGREGTRPNRPEPQGAGEEVPVYFLRDETSGVRLVALTRIVPRPATHTSILEALLLQPPNRAERDVYNITTAIPDSTTLASEPELVRGVLVVDLSGGIYDVQLDGQLEAYAQIVCTATRIADVRAVTFKVDGEAKPAFDGDGESTAAPLRCSDYASLHPDTAETVLTGPRTGSSSGG